VRVTILWAGIHRLRWYFLCSLCDGNGNPIWCVFGHPGRCIADCTETERATLSTLTGRQGNFVSVTFAQQAEQWNRWALSG